MNKNLVYNKAFTLIEILFVITIISFISVASISYFRNFVDSKKLDGDIFLIKSSFDNLENKVKNKEIYDYEISFSGRLYDLYKQNQIVNSYNTNFELNEDSKIFSMNTTLTYTGAWNIKIYSGDKIINNIVLNQSGTVFTGVMDLYKNYEVKSYVNSLENIFGINFFSEDNLNSSGITTNFTEANTKEDKSGLRTQNLIIKNINNKIEFYSGSSLWDTPNVYLFFEKAGLEKSIKISNN
nr:type II secretion system protein [Candidatus Gracilibacteria bacterium]